MSEKVLGFKQKDVKWLDGGTIRIGNANPVPVNLKSESVTLEWLEKYCKENSCENTRQLFLAAKKEAKKT